MERIYTNATITNSEHAANIVHIEAEDVVDPIVIILTRDEFMSRLKQWLRTMPAEQRQMVIDELVACTLRVLE